MHDLSDVELIERAQSGDLEAIGLVYMTGIIRAFSAMCAGMQPLQALDIRGDKVNQRTIKIEQNSLEHEFQIWSIGAD